MPKRYTSEQFLKLLSIKRPGYVALSEYVNSSTKMKFRCDQGHIIEKVPRTLLSTSGCFLCGVEKVRKKLSFSNDEFVELLKTRTPGVIPLEPCFNNQDKIKMTCVKGHIFYSRPKVLIRGYGCPDCGGSKPLTLEILRQRCSDLLPGYQVVGPYTNNKTDIEMVCNIGHAYKTKPKKILIGHSCRVCSRTKKQNTEEFRRHLFKINPTLTVIGEYLGNKTPILMKCQRGHLFSSKPNGVLNGSGCPLCRHPLKRESQCREIFERLLLRPFPSVRLKNMDRLELDGYCKELNLAFEYDGECHYFPFYGEAALKNCQRRDSKKNDLCKTNQILLIRVPYTVNDSMEAYIKDQLRSIGIL